MLKGGPGTTVRVTKNTKTYLDNPSKICASLFACCVRFLQSSSSTIWPALSDGITRGSYRSLKIVGKKVMFWKNLVAKGFMGPPSGKCEGVIRHILELENGNWMEKIALFREWSIWHPAWLGKLGMNMNFRQPLGVIWAWKRDFEFLLGSLLIRSSLFIKFANFALGI